VDHDGGLRDIRVTFEHLADTLIHIVLISSNLDGRIAESVGYVLAVATVTAYVGHAGNLFETPRCGVLPVSDMPRSAWEVPVASSGRIAVVYTLRSSVIAVVGRLGYIAADAIARRLGVWDVLVGYSGSWKRTFVPSWYISWVLDGLSVQGSSVQLAPPGYGDGCGLISISRYAQVGIVLSHCFARKWVTVERLGGRAGRLSFYAGRDRCPGGDMSLMMILMMIVRRTRYMSVM